MGRLVCFVTFFAVVFFVEHADAQGNVFRAARRRPIVSRPQTTTMSPAKLQIAMRNKNAFESKQGNNGQNNQANAQNTGQGQGNTAPRNQRRQGSGMNMRNIMFCPHQMPSDCPEVQFKPGCYSQNIMTWMGRPCRGCPFDMCERTGKNPMDMAKDMARMGINPMRMLNNMNPMSGMGGMSAMQQAMMYNSNFFENMPPWMGFGGWGNNMGGGGNNQGGGGGGTTAPTNNNNNNNNQAPSTMNPFIWHSIVTK